MDLETAFDRYHPAVFRYLHRLTGDADVADELAQEAFVRLMENDVEATGIEGWLFTVATNLVRDRSRVRSRRRELSEGRELEPEPGEPPDEAFRRSEAKRRVRRALDRLKPRDREMLLMREEGFSYAEIAETVGVADSSVGTLLSRALDRFERAYRSEDD